MKLKVIYKLFDLVISDETKDVRKNLFDRLIMHGLTEAHFCNSILDHCTVLKYNADQWFNFLTKVPNKILLRDLRIIAKLTAQQRQSLNIQWLD
jgi:hypothetical protein